MRRAYPVVVAVVLLASVSFSQQLAHGSYWIHFRDKGAQIDRRQLPSASELGISDRALWRRAKVLPSNRLIDELDLPVYPTYTEQLRSAGITIHATSRWFNAVSAELTPAQRATVSSLPFVQSIEPVARFFRKHPEVSREPVPAPLLKRQSASGIDYGQSFVQLNNIKVVDVHNRGITGEGVIIAMIDDGFNQHNVHPALKIAKVIAEFDFVQRDSNTSRAPGEYITQGNHGAATFSAVGGFENGKLIGAAYGASFILAKTEIDSVEIQLEEDLYVEALEWVERLGADIASSSLGYIDWYTYNQLDGKTATTSKAARIAARKGVLLVTAMGNEGNYRDRSQLQTGTLIAPADADSIVAVGASFSDGLLASFSSTGPTADGRIKPEVVAQGVSVYSMYGEAGYVNLSGTSLSTPLAAGVAALILSADPQLTPTQVREKMMLTANPIKDGTENSATYPNNFYGWGMIDALKAISSSGVIPDQFVLLNNYPNPFNAGTTIIFQAPEATEVELAIYNVLGERVRTLFRGTSLAGENRFVWNGTGDDSALRVASGVYFYRLKTPAATLSNKLIYLK